MYDLIFITFLFYTSIGIIHTVTSIYTVTMMIHNNQLFLFNGLLLKRPEMVEKRKHQEQKQIIYCDLYLIEKQKKKKANDM